MIGLVPSEKPNYSVPALLDISAEEFGDAYDMWLKWRATEKRFLPTELRRQPQPLFDNMIYIDMLFERMLGQQIERMKEKANG